MPSDHRRAFLRSTSGAAAAAMLTHGVTRTARAGSRRPGDTLRLALIGCGGRGQGLAAEFHRLANATVVSVCDPDDERRAATARSLEGDVSAESDLRRVLDDKSIDAVLIATPDHWHTPAALLALQAEKHVYVEKPCSHNLREGRLLADAAARTGLKVQHGTQSRSSGWIRHAIRLLHEGIIGDVLVAKAWNVQKRNPIGKSEPGEPPAHLDYDLWVGPAPMTAYRSNCAHYTWHWWYPFGTGDTGNDGVHELDIARWGLGVESQPDLVGACGGKIAYDDDQQFPDTQYASFLWQSGREIGQRRQLVFEMRLWSRYGLESADNGNAFYGTEGWMFLTKRGSVRLYDERNQERPMPEPPPAGGSHAENFVAAVLGEEDLTAPIATGHLSASLCHLANISTRLGRSLAFDPRTESAIGDVAADSLLGREYREGHWAAAPQIEI